VTHDQGGVNPLTGKSVEHAIIGVGIHAPKAGFLDIGELRAQLVLIAEQAKEAKNQVTVTGGVGHNFMEMQSGLLFAHALNVDRM
jgi:hypothetical protein